MKKAIFISLLLGIAGIILQFWIAYIWFYDPGYEDEIKDTIYYECVLVEGRI